MKKFKYCNDDEMDKVVERFKYGGKSNYIYVRLFDTGQVETIEITEGATCIAVFETEQEMREFFNSEPYVKDLVEEEQLKLF